MSDKTSDKTSDKRLLPCPFCGGEIEILPKGYGLLYGRCMNGCFVSRSENSKNYLIEKLNTRKPMQEIVERLEELFKYNSEQADIYIDGEGAYMREKKEMYMDRANCYGVAIRTVREVGGMND
jgi:hypothetical protein